MSISVGKGKRVKFYNAYYIKAKITVSADDKYPNPGDGEEGGYTLSPESLGLSVIDFAAASTTSGYKVVYDIANEKLKVFEYPGDTAGAATELDNESTVMRSKTIDVIAFGI